MLGDRDKMVSLEETVAAFKIFPKGQMAVLPGTPHAVEQVDIALITFLADQFFRS